LDIENKNESKIRGEGWGDCHTWYQFKFTGSDNHITPYTTWKCRKCFIIFNHMYNYIPDIFDAMKVCKVPNVCSRSLENRSLRYQITGVRRADKEK